MKRDEFGVIVFLIGLALFIGTLAYLNQGKGRSYRDADDWSSYRAR